MCQADDTALLKHHVPVSHETWNDSLFDSLCDAHCHPHDDAAHHDMIPKLKTGHITLMGVRQDDWDCVAQLAAQCNAINATRCIPSFGIHPWFSHRVMAEAESHLEPQPYYERVLTTRIDQEKKDMIACLQPPFPFSVWQTNLKKRLMDHPHALVGEVGLDRSARLLPGGAIEWHGVKPTTVQCAIEHQVVILEAQLTLARDLNRGASIHCVQAQGHLLQLLTAQSKRHAKGASPVRLCLHSFGGSPSTIPQFLQLKGFKIFVSFSVAINARLTPNKLADLICAVPEDRLLIESDLNSPHGVDEAMIEITRIVAKARAWSIEKVVHTTQSNWRAFVGLDQASA